MRKSQYTEHQIVAALKKAESGVAVKDICRELGVSAATFHQWRSKYGGMEASDLKRIKALEEENRRLSSAMWRRELSIQTRYAQACHRRSGSSVHRLRRCAGRGPPPCPARSAASCERAPATRARARELR